MKVLVVSSKYPPEYAGSGLRAHRTYLRLKEKFDIDFDVICSSTENNDSLDYEIDDVNVKRIVSKQWRNLDRRFTNSKLRRLFNAAMFHAEARSVRRVLNNRSFDLVHTFGYSPATATAIRWCRNNNKPLIVELVNTNAIPYQYLPGAKRFFSAYDLKIQSAIVAISEHLREVSQGFGLVENVWVRPNPVDTERFSMVDKSTRLAARKEISSASDSDILIVYVAKFISRKKHTFLIDVLAKLPFNFKLVLAGPPLADRDLVPGLRLDEIPSLMQKAESLGVADRIEITPGFVDTARYLKAADVFCFPAEKEAMGTPLLESISVGIPVVANADEPSFREWVNEGENGYLRSLDAQQWADAVISASQFDDSKKTAMSEAIRYTISTDSIDARYEKLLTAVASTGRGQRINVAEVLAE